MRVSIKYILTLCVTVQGARRIMLSGHIAALQWQRFLCEQWNVSSSRRHSIIVRGAFGINCPLDFFVEFNSITGVAVFAGHQAVRHNYLLLGLALFQFPYLAWLAWLPSKWPWYFSRWSKPASIIVSVQWWRCTKGVLVKWHVCTVTWQLINGSDIASRQKLFC